MWTFRRLQEQDRQAGSAMVEYALLVSFVAVAAVGAVTLLGIGTLALFSPAL